MNIIKDQSLKQQIKTVTCIVALLDIIFYVGLIFFGKYNLYVLLGIILGSGYGILNFIFICVNMEQLLKVQKNKVKNKAIVGYIIRYLFTGIVIVVATKFTCVDVFSFLVTLFFPKLAIFIQAIIVRDFK